MAEFLLELFSEEIPARMQAKAEADLARLLKKALGEAGLTVERIDTYSTPRRLVAHIPDLPARTPDIAEDRRGPRADAPEKAVEGFKRSLPAGAAIEERDEKKGRFLYARIEQPGRPAGAVLADILPGVIRGFPWPKTMRWGAGELRWVRPLQSILCLLDGEVVPVELDGITSGDTTRGHRFLAPDPVAGSGFADYKDKLKKAKVILDPEARRGRILEKAKKLASDAGLDLIDDEAMIAENAGLTEWPYPLLGRFDPAFLDVPEEALVSAMRNHQKYLTLRDPQTGRLAPAFICVANTEADDGGAAITAGNERVLSARLSDARFFWDQDRKTPLDDRLPALADIVFHEKLGALAERVDRIETLAAHIARMVDFSHLGGGASHPSRRASGPPQDEVGVSGDIDPHPEARSPEGAAGASHPSRRASGPPQDEVGVSGDIDPHPEARSPEGAASKDEGPDALVAKVRRAAKLAKADLTTEMVGEFPELQGIAGRYIALERGEDEAVANAIAEHYAPRGPDDACPRDPVSFCIALAEKLDTLVGFFAIDEKPTGSKDPYALRRAALGVIRLIVENELRVKLSEIFPGAAQLYRNQKKQLKLEPPDVLAFFIDRLKVQQREKGVRHDLIDAVFSLGGEDDLVRLLARVAALQDFVATGDGANLLAGYKRATNILKIEEKKDKTSYADADPDPALFAEAAERVLHEKLGAATGEATAALEVEDFADAMRALSTLRAPIDAFFDHVTVNADDPALRKNRLALLARIRAAADTVADFSKIEG